MATEVCDFVKKLHHELRVTVIIVAIWCEYVLILAEGGDCDLALKDSRGSRDIHLRVKDDL